MDSAVSWLGSDPEPADRLVWRKNQQIAVKENARKTEKSALPATNIFYLASPVIKSFAKFQIYSALFKNLPVRNTFQFHNNRILVSQRIQYR